MSKDNDVDKVSKRLKEERFAQKFRHTLKEPKYDAEMWNSKGIQFYALWQHRPWWNKPYAHLTQHGLLVAMDLFSFKYEKDALAKNTTLYILPEQTASLRDFLISKPSGETFIVPWGRGGDFHLSFEKRGLFGPMELNWKYLVRREEWNAALNLSTKKFNEERKRMKEEEKSLHFWFSYAQAEKLIYCLDSVLP